jgi:lipoprotein LpqH
MASRQRFVVSLMVASCVGLVVAGCSESDAADTQPELSKIDIPHAELSATVYGQPLPGVDPAEFMCYRQSGSISITGQDPTDGQPGLSADLQPGNPPGLVRVSLGVDGVLYTAKQGKGSVEDVDQDGSRITVRGTAESWDLAVPITKQFEFSATCN